MPSIAHSVQRNLDLSAAGKIGPGPSDIQVGGVGPENVPETGPMPTNVVNGLPLRGTFPQNFGLATDFTNNTQTTRTGHSMRSPMFPVQPVLAASTQQIKTIIEKVITSTSSVTSTPTPAATSSSSSSGSSSSGTGVTVQVNGSAITNPIVDINNTTPAATGGGANVTFQTDTLNPTNLSGALALFGPSGPSHGPGAVPDPGSTAGTTRVLFENGSWAVPSGGGGTSSYKVETFNTSVTSVANTTAETVMSSYTLAANELAAGQALTHISRGQFSNLTGSAISYTFRFYIDGTVIVGGTAIVINNAFQGEWDMDATTMLVTAGSGGAVEVQGKFNMSPVLGGSNSLLSISQLNSSTFSFDTTISHVIKVTIQMGTASPSALCSQRQMLDARVGP